MKPPDRHHRYSRIAVAAPALAAMLACAAPARGVEVELRSLPEDTAVSLDADTLQVPVPDTRGATPSGVSKHPLDDALLASREDVAAASPAVGGFDARWAPAGESDAPADEPPLHALLRLDLDLSGAAETIAAPIARGADLDFSERLGNVARGGFTLDAGDDGALRAIDVRRDAAFGPGGARAGAFDSTPAHRERARRAARTDLARLETPLDGAVRGGLELVDDATRVARALARSPLLYAVLVPLLSALVVLEVRRSRHATMVSAGSIAAGSRKAGSPRRRRRRRAGRGRRRSLRGLWRGVLSALGLSAAAVRARRRKRHRRRHQAHRHTRSRRRR